MTQTGLRVCAAAAQTINITACAALLQDATGERGISAKRSTAAATTAVIVSAVALSNSGIRHKPADPSRSDFEVRLMTVRQCFKLGGQGASAAS
jgi:hypothetical protein